MSKLIELTKKAQLQSPWKLVNELKRLILLPVVRITFAVSGVQWGRRWKIYGIPIIQKNRHSILTIGSSLQLRSTVRSNPLAPNHPAILSTIRPHARLEIGNDFGMTGGSIVCANHIKIGNRVAVGANSVITDTDFHPPNPIERNLDSAASVTAPVIVEDDVFIGMNTIILKGVTIGEGSMIGAGSVVTKSIPPGVIAAGNPAKIIKKLGTSS